MKTEHLVPLGPNVTRDGRKVRVICNDREGGNPVIALFKRDSASEATSYHFADGTVNLDGTPSPSDLVGHLPPKPREWTIFRNHDGEPQIRSGPTPASGEYVHVREVLPGEADELKDLRRWKDEAMQVFAGPDLQAIGKEIGLPIGCDIGPQILPYIRTLKRFIGNLRQPAVSARVAADADKLLER